MTKKLYFGIVDMAISITQEYKVNKETESERST
jgi:hypothetical protein